MKCNKRGHEETDVEQLFTAIARRDPSKRQIKPVSGTPLVLFDDLDDDSDSEFVCDDEDGEESDLDESDVDSADSGSDHSHTCSAVTSAEKLKDDCARSDHKSQNSLVTHDVLAESVLGPPESSCTVSLQPVDIINSHKNGQFDKKSNNFLVCILCLGDRGDSNDELIECDGCGIVVHEDCYKVMDSVFLSSGASSSSTDAWFCEPCLAGIRTPLCELCPNLSGAFKRTDNNRWVHLLCALYTPGVAFNDPDNFMDVTLTELPSRAWSSHECSLCEERFFAWTGVCISCDAGLCRTFFHVTCAQKQGLLSEPTVDENAVDPYFAQCRQHTDKLVARQRRRNYLAAMSRLRSNKRCTPDPMSPMGMWRQDSGLELSNEHGLMEPRIQRKLEHFRVLYEELRSIKEKPFVPVAKTPLFLENSPVAMRLFVSKAKALQLPLDLTGQSSASDATKAPSGYPIFAPDFISYFFDREKKIMEVLKRISTLQETQRELQIADASASHSYNSVAAQLDSVNAKRVELCESLNTILRSLQQLIPEMKPAAILETVLEQSKGASDLRTEVASLTDENDVRERARPTRVLPSRLSRKRSSLFMSAEQVDSNRPAKRNSPTFQSDGLFSNALAVDKERIVGYVDEHSAAVTTTESVILECFICHGLQDQHLITKCDTCGKAFHLACLDPPLLRMPKRSKLYGWQCCYCTKAVAANTEVTNVDVNAPRQLRRSAAKTAVNQTKLEPNDSQVSKVESCDSNAPPMSSPEPCIPKMEHNGTTSVTATQTMSAPSTTPRRSRTNELGCVQRGVLGTHDADQLNSPKQPVRDDSSDTKSSPSRRLLTGCTRRQQRQSLKLAFTSHSAQLLPAPEPTILVTQLDAMSTVKLSDTLKIDPLKFDAYEYRPDSNSDEEITRLRASKVIKFVQIRDHSHHNDSDSVEQIAPLHMRYMICPDNPGTSQKKSVTERFRMKLKKL